MFKGHQIPVRSKRPRPRPRNHPPKDCFFLTERRLQKFPEMYDSFTFEYNFNFAVADRYLRYRHHAEHRDAANYRFNGEEVTLDLIRTFKAAKGVVIPRFYVCGSVGKKSHLGPDFKPDFDLVIFFDPRNLFDAEDQSKEAFLSSLSNDQLEAAIKELNRRLVSICKDPTNEIQFECDWEIAAKVTLQGIQFDLCPAIDFHVPAPGRLPKASQWRAVLERCAAEGQYLTFLSPSMGEMVVDFVKGQHGFVQLVIKLAKYWVKRRVNTDRYMSARSTIVELLAIKAGQDELKFGSRSLMMAMERMWTVMAMPMDEVKITWPSTLEFPAFKRRRPLCLDFLTTEVKISDDGLGKLMDPVNPFLNYLLNEDDVGVEEGWEQFRKAAAEALRLMREGTVETLVPVNDKESGDKTVEKGRGSLKIELEDVRTNHAVQTAVLYTVVDIFKKVNYDKDEE